MGKHSLASVTRRQAMHRHPAGNRLTGHSGATVYAFPAVRSMATAPAETTTKEGNDNG